ncbi:Calcium sensing receptor, chloroplastic [Cocos nucifera]|uniref:Calcium sensing receptor, chloroplastic n=1 Tax=Cocos nucifera TaxID=13894 RepID=A0A8K0MV11_COCNU|nr:Calcium sensing receptor, chloroplastic [Cocos nucifera]
MAMAVRAAVVTRPPPPRKPASKFQPGPSPPLLSPTPTALSLLALFSTPSSHCEAKAFALSKDDILNSLIKVENAIDQVEDVGSSVLDFSQSVIKVFIDALKPGVDAALPVLRNAAQQTAKVIEGAKPLASATVKTITSSDPSVIVVSAGALFLAYLLLPPIWSAISFNFRGYKGNLSPAQTLDLVSSQNYLMIDIRSEKDKNKAGVPRLPSSAKNKMISVPLEELPSKLKGLVRNVKKAEAEIVGLKISYLKRLNKGSNIIIMDSYADGAKIVARALTSLGFKNCWIMSDGFSGGKGWLQSRLGTDSYNVPFAEVISPSRIIPAAATRFGTTSSTAVRSSRKLLPGSIDN